MKTQIIQVKIIIIIRRRSHLWLLLLMIIHAFSLNYCLFYSQYHSGFHFHFPVPCLYSFFLSYNSLLRTLKSSLHKKIFEFIISKLLTSLAFLGTLSNGLALVTIHEKYINSNINPNKIKRRYFFIFHLKALLLLLFLFCNK